MDERERSALEEIDYGHVDPAVLRETVRRDLPELDRQLAAILANA